jgi:hypothetical protein
MGFTRTQTETNQSANQTNDTQILTQDEKNAIMRAELVSQVFLGDINSHIEGHRCRLYSEKDVERRYTQIFAIENELGYTNLLRSMDAKTIAFAWRYVAETEEYEDNRDFIEDEIIPIVENLLETEAGIRELWRRIKNDLEIGSGYYRINIFVERIFRAKKMISKIYDLNFFCLLSIATQIACFRRHSNLDECEETPPQISLVKANADGRDYIFEWYMN